MAVRVTLAPVARDDLVRIRTWHHQPGAGRAAKEKVQRLLRAIREIGAAPHIWPEGGEPGTQERVVVGHVIVYRAVYAESGRRRPLRVEVVRVFGPGQNR